MKRIFAPAFFLGERDIGTRRFLCPWTKGRPIPISPGTSHPVETLIQTHKMPKCQPSSYCYFLGCYTIHFGRKLHNLESHSTYRGIVLCVPYLMRYVHICLDYNTVLLVVHSRRDLVSRSFKKE